MKPEISDTKFDVHYPITVMQRQFSNVEKLNAALADTVINLEKQHRDTPENAARVPEIATQGGYQTSTRMNLFTQDNKAFKTFRNALLMPAVKVYLNHVFAEDAKILDPWPIGWANILRTGDWQKPHCHLTQSNLASGVYYVAVPDDSEAPAGSIEFINPLLVSQYHGYSPAKRIDPKPGMLLLFPPFYLHYVHPFKTGKERIIVAFDILANRPGMQFVF